MYILLVIILMTFDTFYVAQIKIAITETRIMKYLSITNNQKLHF